MAKPSPLERRIWRSAVCRDTLLAPDPPRHAPESSSEDPRRAAHGEARHRARDDASQDASQGVSEAVSEASSRRPRRVLVTGVTGQDGSWLAEQLLAEGDRVFGLVRPGSRSTIPGLTILEGDLRDAASLRRAVDAAEPDEVYHLAAATFVPGAWDNPDEVLDVNAAGVERLAAALLGSGARARLCHASSAEIFGPPTGRPQNEDHPLLAATPYGQSKARAHLCIARLRSEHGLFACSAILFNHESPRRPPHFVTRKISMAAAAIARGSKEPLVLGSLDAARDWGYAPEYVAAMRLMLRGAEPHDYVVATGRAASVRDFAALAFAHVGLDWRDHVRSEAGLARPHDTAARIGDPSRIKRDLGWTATTTFEELVALMVDADLALLDA